MRILGIDPGLATIGFGLIEKKDYNNLICLDYGIISTKPRLTLPERLSLIRNDLSELIETLKPDQISVEELFFSQNVKTGIQVAQARGVILELCNSKNLPILEIKPNQVKSMITGYGHAEKQQIQMMVMKTLDLKKIPKPDDASDALAIAIALAYQL